MRGLARRLSFGRWSLGPRGKVKRATMAHAEAQWASDLVSVGSLRPLRAALGGRHHLRQYVVGLGLRHLRGRCLRRTDNRLA
jgi:hypothetical protein